MNGNGKAAMVVVLMGVTGVGKTTVGKRLANGLGWAFYDADDFHPDTNVEKMHKGIALKDEDRMPWLKALNALIGESLERGESAVLACSALRETYRRMLKEGHDRVVFVYLSASPEVVRERLEHRVGHFMNPDLLASQFETLEAPADAVVVDAEGSPREVVREIREKLGV
ncbi:MAG TPA: gluconokinase, partial [Rhodothermales bacterium]|nr:gluconokinase [Rhodothermales bacterium]